MVQRTTTTAALAAAASGRGARQWLALLIFATLTVGLLLAGIAPLLNDPNASPLEARATFSVTHGADAERVERILHFWRSKAMPGLVATFLLVDTLAFIPLYAATLLGIRNRFRTPRTAGFGRMAAGRIWTIVMAGLVASDLIENAWIGLLVFQPQVPLDSTHWILRAAGTLKWTCVVALAFLAFIATLSRFWPIDLRRQLFVTLSLVRDLMIYAWNYFVPLAMVSLGLAVLFAAPQTREVLLVLRASLDQHDPGLIFGALSLVAWFTSCAYAFRLLDQLGAARAGATEPGWLRARHQLLLGVAAVLSTSTLLLNFAPNASAPSAVILISAGVSIWIATLLAWEIVLRAAGIPTHETARLVQVRTVAWCFAFALVTIAAQNWLPSPAESLLGAAGLYRPPDQVWRFNPELVALSVNIAPALAVLLAALVLWNCRLEGLPNGLVRGSRAGAASVSLLMLLVVTGLTCGIFIVVAQVGLVGVLASTIWVLTRKAPYGAYSAWLDQRQEEAHQHATTALPFLPAPWVAWAVRWIRGRVVSQIHSPIRLFGALVLVAIIAGNLAGPTMAVVLGTLTIVYLGLAAWGLLFTWVFVYWPKKRGLGNWILAPVVWGLVVAPAPKNEDVARLSVAEASVLPATPTLHQHFIAWRAGLPDRDESPIFAVAAAGGGLRAAYWTSILLADMDDRTCGQFGRHVAVMSGVSGGSVGLALYAAQRRVWEQKPLPARCEPGRGRELRTVLRHDYLSPIVASMVFGDLPQTLIPFRYRYKDRHDALAEAFDGMWAQTFEKDVKLLSAPLVSALPGMDGRRVVGNAAAIRLPMLFFNATGVETGRRAIGSNVVWMDMPADTIIPDRESLTGDRLLSRRMSSIEAALHSARFPGVSPAGTVWGCADRFSANPHGWCDADSRPIGRGPALHVVDGGFFENSGIETVKDVLAELRGKGRLSVHKTLPPVFLIAISNDKNTLRLCSDEPTPRMKVIGLDEKARDELKAFNGLMNRSRPDERAYSENDGPRTALDTLLSVREGRARLELRRAISEFGCPNIVEWSLGDFLRPDDSEPALGWHLSATSFGIMDAAAQQYVAAFPFDQAACPAWSSAPRGRLGAEADVAQLCDVEPIPVARRPLKPLDFRQPVR